MNWATPAYPGAPDVKNTSALRLLFLTAKPPGHGPKAAWRFTLIWWPWLAINFEPPACRLQHRGSRLLYGLPHRSFLLPSQRGPHRPGDGSHRDQTGLTPRSRRPPVPPTQPRLTFSACLPRSLCSALFLSLTFGNSAPRMVRAANDSLTRAGLDTVLNKSVAKKPRFVPCSSPFAARFRSKMVKPGTIW